MSSWYLFLTSIYWTPDKDTTFCIASGFHYCLMAWVLSLFIAWWLLNREHGCSLPQVLAWKWSHRLFVACTDMKVAWLWTDYTLVDFCPAACPPAWGALCIDRQHGNYKNILQLNIFIESRPPSIEICAASMLSNVCRTRLLADVEGECSSVKR